MAAATDTRTDGKGSLKVGACACWVLAALGEGSLVKFPLGASLLVLLPLAWVFVFAQRY